MVENYYSKGLNALKLEKVYQSAYPRVHQYLAAEIDFVRQHLKGDERVLEIGAGYGRIMKELAPYCKSITGVDISADNLEFGQEYLMDAQNARLMLMDAHNLSFNEAFDVILCLQNGLSAIKARPDEYVKVISNNLSPGGIAFISTYSPKFWQHRLKWFQEQASKGLLGEVDLDLSCDGVVVCKDGFCSASQTVDELKLAGEASGCEHEIVEVDESIIFLVVHKKNLA